jgi:hypothetical protein
MKDQLWLSRQLTVIREIEENYPPGTPVIVTIGSRQVRTRIKSGTSCYLGRELRTEIFVEAFPQSVFWDQVQVIGKVAIRKVT